MNLDAVGFIAPLSMPAMPASTQVQAPSGQFASWFTEQLTDVNSQLTSAEHGIQQLAAGDASNLHQVMINLEEAKISMQLVMQVRTHLLDAYRELMQMQM